MNRLAFTLTETIVSKAEPKPLPPTTTPAAPAVPDITFNIFPRIITEPALGQVLAFESGPEKHKLGELRKEWANDVDRGVDQFAATFFSLGEGKPYRDALERVQTHEADIAAAVADESAKQNEWDGFIAADDLDAARRVEPAIAAAKSLANRLRARLPFLQKDVAELRTAAAARLAELVRGDLTRVATESGEKAEEARLALGPAVSPLFLKWLKIRITADQAKYLSGRTEVTAKYFTA